ncbi:hypothetical protein [Yellowstone lake phycodnavirus 3]|uniref:hypothetical protein n=1 Tax=Yellowstone lake phycodnavirus 3 TaxID=1586715 RepID=UPI0006EBDE9F|nr:hypothetical protein AR677_gp194 [Yellowstone lake phycodnavirus 3]BAT22693.1 hypothetical protein [Yellowstone lake phycodnavirus 3]
MEFGEDFVNLFEYEFPARLGAARRRGCHHGSRSRHHGCRSRSRGARQGRLGCRSRGAKPCSARGDGLYRRTGHQGCATARDLRDRPDGAARKGAATRASRRVGLRRHRRLGSFGRLDHGRWLGHDLLSGHRRGSREGRHGARERHYGRRTDGRSGRGESGPGLSFVDFRAGRSGDCANDPRLFLARVEVHGPIVRHRSEHVRLEVREFQDQEGDQKTRQDTDGKLHSDIFQHKIKRPFRPPSSWRRSRDPASC